MSKPLIYLASAYSHPDAVMREHRFITACRIAGAFMAKGHHIFSPIAHTHPIAVHTKLPVGWDFWQQYDYAILSRFDELWVVDMPGSSESKGMKAEIEYACTKKLPLRVVEEKNSTVYITSYNPEYHPGHWLAKIIRAVKWPMP